MEGSAKNFASEMIEDLMSNFTTDIKKKKCQLKFLESLALFEYQKALQVEDETSEKRRDNTWTALCSTVGLPEITFSLGEIEEVIQFTKDLVQKDRPHINEHNIDTYTEKLFCKSFALFLYDSYHEKINMVSGQAEETPHRKFRSTKVVLNNSFVLRRNFSLKKLAGYKCHGGDLNRTFTVEGSSARCFGSACGFQQLHESF